MNGLIDMNKTCPKCRQNKPLDEYHHSSSAYNKRQTYCKVCTNMIDKIKRDKYKSEGPTIIRTDKACVSCNVIKPIADFPVSRQKPDGHLGYCKPCWVKYVRSRQLLAKGKGK
jgi:hypothetical protein